MPDLPSGTVTFLFTDIEGSTALWERDRTAMAAAVQRHIALLDAALQAHGGIHFKTVGDAVQAAFPTAPAALAAALDAQRALRAEEWGEVGPLQVRMALHAGEATPNARGDYLAAPLNRLSRLLSSGHGGQILVSQTVQQLSRGALPPGAELRDLGDHRLRDLLEPERVFQLLHPDLSDQFPLLKSLESRPNNLPLQPTPFLGREHEVAQVVELLRRADVRFLTLTGPGGTGKTRLALQAAAELLDDFPDGIFFVPFASLTDPELVIATIATTLGVREEGGKPIQERLHDHLATKQLLLLLDNLEHLTAAAPVIGELLGVSAELTVLATSRTPLRLRAEREFAVPPLGLPRRKPPPTLEQLSQFEAVRLFIERAQAVKADFAIDNENAPAVAEICWRLDGLPLAIELAAARVRLLPPQAMLARLDRRLSFLTGGARDAPTRQRTLRATIEWSHDLLSADEQTLFRRLAVFTGGCTLEAAEAVVNHDGASDAFGGVERLLEHNLLRQEDESGSEPRFTILETIREFGLEQLIASSEETVVRDAHAAYFLHLAEAAAPELERGNQADWYRRLDAEHPNVRAAVAWLQQRGDAASIQRLGAGLWFYWFLSHAHEGLHWLEDALALADRADPRRRAAALYAAGNLARRLDNPERGEALHREELALRQEIGDHIGIGKTLLSLALEAVEQEDFAQGKTLLLESVERLRTSGDPWAFSIALMALGYVAFLQGDLEQAKTHYTEGLSITRRMGDQTNTVRALGGLGDVALAEGDAHAAHALFEESLALTRALGRSLDLPFDLGDLARAEIELGNLDRADALLEEALSLDEETMAPLLRAWLHVNRGRAVRLRGSHNPVDHYREAFRLAGEVRRFGRSLVAECLDEVAAFAAATGQGLRAPELWGAADRQRELIGLWWRRSGDIEEAISRTREALGEQVFGQAWDAGRALSSEQAVAAGLALVDELARNASRIGVAQGR